MDRHALPSPDLNICCNTVVPLLRMFVVQPRAVEDLEQEQKDKRIQVALLAPIVWPELRWIPDPTLRGRHLLKTPHELLSKFDEHFEHWIETARYVWNNGTKDLELYFWKDPSEMMSAYRTLCRSALDAYERLVVNAKIRIHSKEEWMEDCFLDWYNRCINMLGITPDCISVGVLRMYYEDCPNRNPYQNIVGAPPFNKTNLTLQNSILPAGGYKETLPRCSRVVLQECSRAVKPVKALPTSTENTRQFVKPPIPFIPTSKKGLINVTDQPSPKRKKGNQNHGISKASKPSVASIESDDDNSNEYVAQRNQNIRANNMFLDKHNLRGGIFRKVGKFAN